ncbi:MAG: class I SAM-dependent methyltransferase [Methyloglobulus sp.]
MISSVFNPGISLVKLAHSLVRERVNPGDIVIDATVGNGHDTLLLSTLVGATGKVFGFDIQETAIVTAKSILQNSASGENVSLFVDSHANMKKNIPTHYHRKISAIMFNLGYLPGSNKQVITQTYSTLTALNDARELLASNGIITVLAYPGHSGGEVETDNVKNWCLSLAPEDYQVQLHENSANSVTAPKFFAIFRGGIGIAGQ